MNCPHCNSHKVEQTAEFDLTNIDTDECQHDFVCKDCGALFVIRYSAYEAAVVGQSENF